VRGKDLLSDLAIEALRKEIERYCGVPISERPPCIPSVFRAGFSEIRELAAYYKFSAAPGFHKPKPEADEAEKNPGQQPIP
jgi:hypothetical protein